MSFRDQAIASLYTPADNRLEGFYIPALKQAVRYDRVTGYYRSSSLVVAAAGVSRFVANGGTMRIIAGTELEELDIKAIEKGEPLSADDGQVDRCADAAGRGPYPDAAVAGQVDREAGGLVLVLVQGG